MSEENIKNTQCGGSCEGCKSDCKERDLRLPFGQFSNIKKVYGIISGKGGVGKSLVTSMLASAVQARGYSAAVLDADITGPSIPKAFGIKDKAAADEMGLQPAITTTGIKIMSVNLLLEDENSPVVWRGPVISGVIQQFWQEVAWGDVDYMFIDMPPGTGDVPLTVFQRLPVDGLIIVTTPQELVSMIVKKAFNMAKLMNIPVVGIIENMSYISCPDCGKMIPLFGESKTEKLSQELGTELLAKLPLDSKITALVDKGAVELSEITEINEVAEKIIALNK